LSSAGGLPPTGPAADGEVEDYRVVISTNPWQNPRNARDVDDDDVIAPIDALRAINELNNRQYSDPVTGALSDTPPFPLGPDGKAPYFYDVNGDGYATSIDALIVINELNRQARAATQVMAVTAAASTEFVGDGGVVTGLADDANAALEAGLVASPIVVSPTAVNPTRTVAAVAEGTERRVPVDRRNVVALRASAAARTTAVARRARIARPAAADVESLLDAIAEDVGTARHNGDPREEAFARLG
jgi:hypothetical protein